MEYSIKTHKGKRKSNQDCSSIFINESNLFAFLLADGLGGHQAGDIASEMVVSQLGNSWEHTDFVGDNIISVQNWLDDQINRENKRLYNVANKYSDLEGMGTTLVLAVILENKILISNIGDSRAYIYKDGDLEQITEDHSFVSELQRKGELTDEEAKNHYNRNALTRSLGVKHEVVVDFFSIVKNQADIIMLSSDGLTNAVGEDELIAILSAKKLTIDQKSSALVQLALDNQGSDNITVLLIDLNSSKKKVSDEVNK